MSQEEKERRVREKLLKRSEARSAGKMITEPLPAPSIPDPTSKPLDDFSSVPVKPSNDPETAKELAGLIVSILDMIKAGIDGVTKADGELNLRNACRLFWTKYIEGREIAVSSGVLVAVASSVYVGQSFFSEKWKSRVKGAAITIPVEAKGAVNAHSDNGGDGHGKINVPKADPSFADRFRA